jgi:DMSO/TMAO reductase YedYZ molybdopterin-dependent catalytic subunit
MNLTIVGNGGTIILNETGIGGLQTYSGYGGYKNAVGVLKGTGNYTGVPLTTLCSLVQTLTNTSVVKFLAADNYTQTLTYSQVCGNFTTYDNTTGQPTPHNQSLTPILACYFNGQNLSSNDGPLRLAIVGPEGLVTDAAYWLKEIIRIEVMDQAVPEFPSFMILPVLFLVTLTAAFTVKFHPERLGRKAPAR